MQTIENKAYGFNRGWKAMEQAGKASKGLIVEKKREALRAQNLYRSAIGLDPKVSK